ncbi:MAG: universal stress protein [Myxococcales bacterium]|nr:universal stress protein [Myxococcales bacterium]
MTIPAKRILVPIDFSATSRAAFERAKELAHELGSEEIALITIWEPSPYLSPDQMVWLGGGDQESFWTHARRDLRERLEAFAPRPEGEDYTLTYEVVAGYPADSIVNAAASADLVVMGTHGRTGLFHALLGSVAERVVRLAPCPVLTLRAVPEKGGTTGAHTNERDGSAA